MTMAAKTKARRRRSRGERGQALVEFALVGIIFFMMVFGIIDMARLFQSWVTVQHAAREGARYAITGQSACDGAANRTDCIEWTSKRATTGLSGGGEDATDEEIGVSFKAWDYVGSNWTGPTSNKTGKPCDQIEVTVSYTHQVVAPIIKVFAPSGITISGSQRMTNEPYGPCTSGDGVG
jgi:hypothetical protein